MKRVFASRTYIKYAECKQGQVLVEGVFKASEMGNFDKLNHIFKTSAGETVLNSTGKLDYLVGTYLTPGMTCRVVYLGKIVLLKGKMKGKESHDFELYVDDSTDAVMAPEEDVVRADTASLPEMSI
jgi:hypothetical protein